MMEEHQQKKNSEQATLPSLLGDYLTLISSSTEQWSFSFSSFLPAMLTSICFILPGRKRSVDIFLHKKNCDSIFIVHPRHLIIYWHFLSKVIQYTCSFNSHCYLFDIVVHIRKVNVARLPFFAKNTKSSLMLYILYVYFFCKKSCFRKFI